MLLNQYCCENPRIFVDEDREQVVNKLLGKFKVDISVLKQFPQVIKSMFTLCGQPVPEELRIDSPATPERNKILGDD